MSFLFEGKNEKRNLSEISQGILHKRCFVCREITCQKCKTKYEISQVMVKILNVENNI